MKKKGKIILTGIAACCLMAACGQEEISDNESKGRQTVEEETGDDAYKDIEPSDDETEEKFMLTYDLKDDVAQGLLYSTKDGKLADPDGNVIPEYDKYYVDDMGYVVYKKDETAVEGYFAGEGGKIVYMEPETMEYSPGSRIEELRNYASWANCNMDIIDGPYYTSLGDDEDYFDELVLGAWYDENGVPRAKMLPKRLANVFVLSQVRNLKFIDGEKCTMDQIKRTSKDEDTIYAFILSNISKRQDSDTDVYMEGIEYTSLTPVVVHGNFSKILNGDDLLVFAHFNGLASDDTPNFQGKYIQIINGRFD